MGFRAARYPPSRIRATAPSRTSLVQIQALVQPVAGNVRVLHRVDVVVIPEDIQKQVHGVRNHTIDVKGECCRHRFFLASIIKGISGGGEYRIAVFLGGVVCGL
jgi:hypothetical protein